TVVTNRARFELPGVVPLGTGIRLLAVGDYPASASRAENADDNRTQHRTRARDYAADATAVVRRPRLRGLWPRSPWLSRRRSPAPLAPAPSVRAVPAEGPPGWLSIRETESPAMHSSHRTQPRNSEQDDRGALAGGDAGGGDAGGGDAGDGAG